MSYEKTTPQMIHVCVNLKSTELNKGEIWATKYLGCTNTKGSRLKFWRMNASLELIGKAKVVSWDDSFTGQTEQLANALGADYKVLQQWEILFAATKHAIPS